MGLTLDSWLDSTHGNSNLRQMFCDLVEHLGMKIPIMAAQKPFERNEEVFLALPTFLTPRYDDHFHNPLGRVIVHDVDDVNGFYMVSDASEERCYFWLPCFFFHRDSSLAKKTYQEQLFHMMKIDREEAAERIPMYRRKYTIPDKFRKATPTQLHNLFYEAYDKPSLIDLKRKTKSLGF